MYIVILYTYTCMYTKLLHTTLQRLFFQFQRALLKNISHELSGNGGVFPGDSGHSFQFFECDSDFITLYSTSTVVPVVFCRSLPPTCGFDWKKYTSVLKTSVLGRTVMYSKTATTTMDFLDR